MTLGGTRWATYTAKKTVIGRSLLEQVILVGRLVGDHHRVADDE